MKKYTVILIATITGIFLLACKIIKTETTTTKRIGTLSQNSGYALFKDKDFPFTFEYPSDWAMFEQSTSGHSNGYGTKGGKPKDILIEKNIDSSGENRKIGEWGEVTKGETPFPSNARPPSNKITLDSKEFDMYYIGSGPYFYIVRITDGDDVYEIQFNEQENPPSGKIINNLKSSFKFSK
jgi:hypothetical protein